MGGHGVAGCSARPGGFDEVEVGKALIRVRRGRHGLLKAGDSGIRVQVAHVYGPGVVQE